MRVATCNTQGRSDSLPDFRATVTAVRREQPDFVGWQEVNTDRQRQVLRATMGPAYSHRHADLAVPISVAQDWRVLREGRRKTHDGVRFVTPARWVVWVVARNGAGETVAFVNTHFVSGAWNNKPKYRKALRRALWVEHWQVLRDVTARLAQQWPCVIVGDLNRVDVRPWHPDLTWADNRGIDKVAVVGLQVDTRARILTRSDHDARVVDLKEKP